MTNVNEKTYDLVGRILGLENSSPKNCFITLHTKTTLSNKVASQDDEQKSIKVFNCNNYNDLTDLYEIATNCNFTILFYPNPKYDVSNWLFFDIDKFDKSDKLKVKQLLDVFDEFEIVEFISICDSGTGLHVYIECDFLLSTNDFTMFVSTVSQRLKQCGFDVDNKGIYSRMRMVGTINEKYNKRTNVISLSNKKLSNNRFDKVVGSYKGMTKENKNYYNKVLINFSLQQTLEHYYKEENGGRHNTILKTFYRRYNQNEFNDTRDLYNELMQAIEYTRDTLFAQKNKDDYFTDDEYLSAISKSKWVDNLQKGDFSDVEFTNNKFERFFTR